MGKRQHQSDKMYLTAKEWSQFFGGKKADKGGKSDFKRLPFDHCSLSLQPYEHPYCTKNGVIFDLVHIVPYLKKFKTNPITGEAMDAKSLIKLNIAQNASGKYHCPVTFKVFTDNSHIVAVKGTGNVYAYEAVEELNIKNKNWKDLLTDEPFKRKDLITLQDPTNVEKFNISMFYHVQNNVKVETEAEKKAKAGASYNLNATSSTAKDVLQELYKEYKPAEKVEEKKAVPDHLNAAHYSTGMMAAGFTSTAMTPQTAHEAEIIDEDVIRYERIKKKGYVRLVTNKGVLNLELHCEMVPKTCENFMKLCERGYYKGTKFHRSIKHFMIQGGDPTGTGTGGESIWNKPFPDEFKPNLSHTGRGILSMANSGPDTNKSQFFITFRSCKHLDEKHSIFGKVVGGLDTIQAMENVKTDEHTDKPLEDILIEDTLIFVNPYDEVDEAIAKERQAVKDKEAKSKAPSIKSTAVTLNTEEKPTVYRSGVGKYISSSSSSSSSSSKTDSSTSKRPSSEQVTSSTESHVSSQKKKSKSSHRLTDFSGW